MRDFVLIGFTPRHRTSAVPAETLDELQGLGHVYGVDAFGGLHRLLEEGAVGVAVLTSERRVHEDGVRTIVHVADVGFPEVYVRPEPCRIGPGHLQRGVRHVVPHDHPRAEQPCADGEHARPASQVHDLHALDVAVGVRSVQDVRGYDGRGHVLFKRRIGVLEVPHGLEADLQVSLPHRGEVGRTVIYRTRFKLTYGCGGRFHPSVDFRMCGT